MKKLALIALLAVVLPGCYLYADFTTVLDGDMDGHGNGSKKGKASHEVYLGIIAVGDSSTNAAAKQGKIKTMTSPPSGATRRFCEFVEGFQFDHFPTLSSPAPKS